MTDYAGTYFTCDTVPGWQSRGVDSNGLRWAHVGDISGWDDPPDARSQFVARQQASGSFDAPVYDDNRVISFTGTVVAPTRALQRSAALILGRLARALRLGTNLTGHDEDGDKTVWGRRAPSWKMTSLGPLGWKYQVQIVCPDPYKYGPERTFTTGLPSPGSGGLVFPLFDGTGMLEFGTSGDSGRITLSNPGTDDAWPVFTVTGPVLGGLSITDVASGRQIVYAGDVPDGANLLIIDAQAGRATLNGADRTGELTVKQWFPVPSDGVDSGPGVLLDDAYLVDMGDGSVTLSSPDLDEVAPGIGATTDASAPTCVVQFATFGPAGQTGTLTATVRPTYQ